MPYSEFVGAQSVTETTYDYDGGVLVRAVAVAEPRWTAFDRGLVLALLAERRDTCTQCGHPMSVCRDPDTAGKWQVLEEVCQPSRVAQATAENVSKSKRRGVVLKTRRT